MANHSYYLEPRKPVHPTVERAGKKYKVCIKCEVEKETTEYPVSGVISIDPQCKQCKREAYRLKAQKRRLAQRLNSLGN